MLPSSPFIRSPFLAKVSLVALLLRVLPEHSMRRRAWVSSTIHQRRSLLLLLLKL
jgi:hypothetical protein